jgi:hypothetical protein
LPQQTPRGLTEEFSEDPTKQALWRAFVRKGRLDVESKTLGQVVIELGAFLLPPAIGARSEEPFRRRWRKGNGNNWNQMPRKIFPGLLDFSHPGPGI